jgi:glycosyltransferase involved in cell wall biosynthesis
MRADDKNRIAVTVDARALQDPAFRDRGIGHHGFTLVQHLKKKGLKNSSIDLVAVVDPMLPDLKYSHEVIFDDVISFRKSRPADLHINLSPMTHVSMFGQSECVDRAVLKIAIFHDLIPLQLPHLYLTSAPTRLKYLTNLRWLPCYDLFACNSECTARELRTRLPMLTNRVFTTGIAIRESIGPAAALEDKYREEAFPGIKLVLVAGGGDPRKNVEMVAKVVGEVASGEVPLQLDVLGKYNLAQKSHLRLLFKQAGAEAGRLRFLEDLPDIELGSAYKRAHLVIVPSLAEGFSMPIIEASYFNVPVLASRIDAHVELLGLTDALFSPENEAELSTKLNDYLTDEVRRDELKHHQSTVHQRFNTESVVERFIERIDQARSDVPQDIKSPSVHSNVRPAIALLTPLRPQHTGVADYANALIAPLSELCHLTIGSDAIAAQPIQASCSVIPIESVRNQLRRFDYIIYAFGNSELHLPIFNFALAHRGAGIFHDARMLDFYYWVRGPEATIRLAASEGVINPSIEKIESWLSEPRKMETYFLSELMDAVEPAIVHSQKSQRILSTKYRKPVVFLPFPIQRSPSPSLSRDNLVADRRAARQVLGIDEKTYIITTFGIITKEKGVTELVWAAQLLRQWGLKFKLVFCGTGVLPELMAVRRQALELGLSEVVVLFETAPDEQLFRKYLLASDLAVQLRTHSIGSISGALSDAIAFALPCVATSDLAESLDAPSYVTRIPNEISPLLLAEAIMSRVAIRNDLDTRIGTTRNYLAEHSPASYARRLIETLHVS